MIPSTFSCIFISPYMTREYVGSESKLYTIKYRVEHR